MASIAAIAAQRPDLRQAPTGGQLNAAVCGFSARDVIAVSILKYDVVFRHPVGSDVIGKAIEIASYAQFRTVDGLRVDIRDHLA